ncbi:hypothetical protein NL676_031203 [Syzygium grande]|nr:hypothetical protein NL676_031203 [Syzygium grande]
MAKRTGTFAWFPTPPSTSTLTSSEEETKIRRETSHGFNLWESSSTCTGSSLAPRRRHFGRSVYLPEAKGAKWHSESSPDVSIIEAKGNFKIKAIVAPITEKDSFIHNYGITQEDCYAHLDLSFKFYSLLADVSGDLGQTYAKNYVSRA